MEGRRLVLDTTEIFHSTNGSNIPSTFNNGSKKIDYICFYSLLSIWFSIVIRDVVAAAAAAGWWCGDGDVNVILLFKWASYRHGWIEKRSQIHVWLLALHTHVSLGEQFENFSMQLEMSIASHKRNSSCMLRPNVCQPTQMFWNSHFVSSIHRQHEWKCNLISWNRKIWIYNWKWRQMKKRIFSFSFA